jgi:hypothetical protein
MISQAAEQLDCDRLERLDSIETLLNTVALALLIAEVALLQGATPRARVSINPLSVTLESEVSIEPSPRNCPWTLRRLVLAKPPVEVPKEVDTTLVLA